MICHDCGVEYVQWGEAWDEFYCRSCHTKHFARSPRAHCPICQERKLYLDFAQEHQGYALRRDGHNIYLYCSRCEKAFLALPETQQAFYIRSRCNQMFPPGQVIYGLVDPESHLIRSVGRTYHPERRLQEHLRDRRPYEPWLDGKGEIITGLDGEPYYARAHWVYDLSVKGLQPTMKILSDVEVAPAVVEWEQRYILHGIQQGWPLLNIETVRSSFVTGARASQLDFLHCSFESLVQEGFIREKGIEAFVHRYYRG